MNTNHADQAGIRPVPEIIRRVDLPDIGLAPRRRRLRRALYDLGLDRLDGVEWCRLDAHGLQLAALDDHQLDSLIRTLEDVADRLPPRPRPESGPGQLSLGF